MQPRHGHQFIIVLNAKSGAVYLPPAAINQLRRIPTLDTTMNLLRLEKDVAHLFNKM